MNEWQAIFGEMRNSVRKSLPLTEALAQLIEFARNNPTLCDEPAYWNQVASHDFRLAFETMAGWGEQGIAQLKPKEGWEFLLLDLGDCPEIFQLDRPGGQELMSESKLQAVLSQKLVVHISAFEDCFVTAIANSFDLLFGNNIEELLEHHVSELDDDLLDWTDGPEDTDFHGNNGYLLWLVLCSLAFLSPFSDEEYCQRVLQGRDKLYLLSGYEEIFSCLATVTATGLVYAECEH